MQIRPTSAYEWGVGWIAAEPAFMERASHALASGGDVWLIDPVDGDGLEELIAPLGTVRGVLQLLDRHPRDGAALAERHGVPLLVVPENGVPGSPFTVLPVAGRRWWHEVALWWPEHRALVVPEALGTAPYYLAPGALVGVHPMMRMTPPAVLDGLDPQHLLPGHGAPVSGEATAGAVHDAISRSRRDIPGALRSAIGSRISR
ncbi:MAG: hypothetical protein JHC74_00945 [Thermoleophilia bacterium]|nr:hypothetical protein [Thermoleophilia bacterium]